MFDLAIIRVIFEAVREVFRFLCTEQGQAFVALAISDRAKFDKAISDFGSRFEKFVKDLQRQEHLQRQEKTDI